MSQRISQLFKSLVFAGLILGLGGVALGCKDKEAWQEPAPEEVFRSFLMDWFRGERDNAFEAIVESDRAALTAPLEDLNKTHGEGVLPEDYQALVVGRVNNPYDFKSIAPKEPLTSAPEVGQKLELTLNFHDGHTGSATMVWSGERWLVDLPLEAGAAPAPPAPAEQGDSKDEPPQVQPPIDSAPDAGPTDLPNNILPSAPSNTP